jgi:hypothetical protein
LRGSMWWGPLYVRHLGEDFARVLVRYQENHSPHGLALCNRSALKDE